MTTDAQSDVQQLRSRVQQIRVEFVRLASRLRAIADGMDNSGTVPSIEVLENIRTAAVAFESLKSDVITFAQPVIGAEALQILSPQSTNDLDQCLETCSKAQDRQVLSVLEKALGIREQVGHTVPKLQDFNQKTHQLYNTLSIQSGSALQASVAENKALIDAISAIITLAEQWNTLDDEKCELLRETAVTHFDKSLVIATLRGHLQVTIVGQFVTPAPVAPPVTSQTRPIRTRQTMHPVTPPATATPAPVSAFTPSIPIEPVEKPAVETPAAEVSTPATPQTPEPSTQKPPGSTTRSIPVIPPPFDPVTTPPSNASATQAIKVTTPPAEATPSPNDRTTSIRRRGLPDAVLGGLPQRRATPTPAPLPAPQETPIPSADSQEQAAEVSAPSPVPVETNTPTENSPEATSQEAGTEAAPLIEEIKAQEEPTATQPVSILPDPTSITTNLPVKSTTRIAVQKPENPKLSIPMSYIQKKTVQQIKPVERIFETNANHEIIMTVITQSKLNDIDFGEMSRENAERSAQALQTWFSMETDHHATADDVKQILTLFGFEVNSIEKNDSGSMKFSARCTPLQDLSILPPHLEESRGNGNYSISCFWGRPTEGMLLGEVDATPVDSNLIVFHFGILSEERRLDIQKSCKKNDKELLIIDDILMLYLTSLAEERLASFFGATLPYGYMQVAQ